MPTAAAPAAVVALLCGVLLLGLGLGPVAVVGVVLGAASYLPFARILRQGSVVIALGATAARPVAEVDEPRLHNLVENLCVGVGLAKPGLWVVDDDAANALSVAASVDSAAIVVTRGLLRRLSLVEMEGVLAHEVGRIRRGEAMVGTLAVTCLGGTAARLAPPGGLARGTAAEGPQPAPVHWGATPVLLAAPLTRVLVARGEPVQTWADLAAVEITRYPPGLASALEKLGADVTPVAASSPAIAHLWAHGRQPEGSFTAALRRVYEPAPPIGPRLEVLQEL